MDRSGLIHQIKSKKSFLSVGLDTDIQKIPKHLLELDDPIFEFNKQIIDATSQFCVSYKLNTAFYECRGVKGWQSLQKTFDYLPKDCFTIADAKRGDIGNTSTMYANAFFNKEASGFNFDAVTVAPYMGNDSVSPFLNYKDKWTIILALTSNVGANDFQYYKQNDQYLFEKVIESSQTWGSINNMMYVVGATKPESFKDIRSIAPDYFLLVPGVGAQGGSLAEVCKYGLNKDCGLLINASRSIIYASNEEDFAAAAFKEAQLMQQEMESILSAADIIK